MIKRITNLIFEGIVHEVVIIFPTPNVKNMRDRTGICHEEQGL